MLSQSENFGSCSKNSDREKETKIPIRLKITMESKNYYLKITVRACMYARVCAYIWQIVIRAHDHHTTSTPTEHTTTGKGGIQAQRKTCIYM